MALKCVTLLCKNLAFLSQRSLCTVCKSFIWVHLDCKKVTYDKLLNITFSNRIKLVGYNAALSVSEARKGWSRENLHRSSHLRYSVKRDVLKNFGNFTGKCLCWSLFLIKLQTFSPATILKEHIEAGVFLWKFAKF